MGQGFYAYKWSRESGKRRGSQHILHTCWCPVEERIAFLGSRWLKNPSPGWSTWNHHWSISLVDRITLGSISLKPDLWNATNSRMRGKRRRGYRRQKSRAYCVPSSALASGHWNMSKMCPNTAPYSQQAQRYACSFDTIWNKRAVSQRLKHLFVTHRFYHSGIYSESS